MTKKKSIVGHASTRASANKSSSVRKSQDNKIAYSAVIKKSNLESSNVTPFVANPKVRAKGNSSVKKGTTPKSNKTKRKIYFEELT